MLTSLAERRLAAPLERGLLLDVQAKFIIRDHGRALVDEAAPDPEAAAVALAERLELARAVAQLGERDAQIVRLRYGFEDGQEWSLREIGRRWGISAEGVRSILTRALRKLRDQLQGDAACSAA